MTTTPLPDTPPVFRRVSQPASWRPHLFVVVDTEEEFDWNAPFSRSNTGVTAMRHIGRAQTIFDRFGIKPTYVIDYPVATKAEAFEPLLAFHREDRCQIGAHIHPWVNPPYEEEVNGPNSFVLNLDPLLQRAKLTELRSAISERFGSAPLSFKAGRYGLGAATVAILDDLGFEVDWSISPAMDFRVSGGPSFVGFDANPFFLTSELLEIPCTIDYVGWLGSARPVAHRLASRPQFEPLRVVGVLSKLGAVNRVMLTPEGNTFEEMRALVRSLFARGCRVFTMSFHSPSADPGHTPYVRSEADLQVFLRDIERFCEFFMRDMNGIATSPQSFRHQVASMVES